MERFFYESGADSSRWAELTEFVYRTYSDAKAILHMPWRVGKEIVSKGAEETRRKEYWLMYCCMYPHMTSENFQQFSTWYDSLTHPEPKKTKEEIMNTVESIINMTVR